MLILASGSPRRRELLSYIQPDFKVVILPTSEDFLPGTPPNIIVETLALRKACAVQKLHPHDTIIGADTIVVLDGKIFEKPENEAHACEMLKTLSGREHQVFTGVAILNPDSKSVFSEETLVRFTKLTAKEITAYVATGEPLDKAGGYGIQGLGATLVESICGDFYNVMGLPVCRLAKELRREENYGK
ncbi:MAG: Maf family protein [Lachnospiraceae bacterium]|nr:Maf family protein [Lachnospiraceae bacterium]